MNAYFSDAFQTPLGAIGLVIDERSDVLAVRIGYPSVLALRSAFDREFPGNQRQRLSDLADRLIAFAHGDVVRFDDVRLPSGELTDFQRRVQSCCRAIPYGETVTYSELARRADAPRAYRAVGRGPFTAGRRA